ncbi:MAG: ABC transporter ATP-binding protein/permease [Granulosicoccus sp.]|nr:ABC transporter ATP-binding protein/permease [Granulosicoccus sp.]
MLITLLLAGVSAVTEIYLYLYLGRLLDWMGSTPREEFINLHGGQLVLMVLVVALLRPLSLLGSRAYINLALAPGIANATRWQNHRYVLRQSLGFFQNDFAGRVAQKIMQTGNALRESVINVIDGVWLMFIYLIGIGVLFVDIHSTLLIPVVAWMICYVLVVLTQVPPVRQKSRALSESNSALTGRIVDSYTNIQAVKLFAHAEQEEKFAAEGITRLTTDFRTLMRAILGMTAWLTVLNTLLIVGVAMLSIHLWMQRSISVGEIAVANGLIIRLNQMSGWILRTVTSLFENIGTVQNGIETISQPLSVTDKKDAEDLRVTQGEIRFRKVNFNYGATIPVIHDFDLAVQPGEKIGLVGRSGAGKSTLVNLLMRFYELDSGRITIDGTDISSVTQNSLRSNIAVVTQDTSLLHRSIKDNIRYGQPDATMEQVEAAAISAKALGFIPELTDPVGRKGFDAFVGERGVKLSGGQRQRIAIARVILKDAPILVLDEATSALDSEVEAAIQGSLNKLMEGKTVLAVAHRLSTIASLDRLVVLDQGRIIEQGTHQALLDAGGLYASLWQRQSGGFLPS